MRELQPGGQLAGYRIDAVEREDKTGAVLLAHDLSEDRAVVLHVAGAPPGELSTTRFLEGVRRVSAIEHPHLLAVYGAHTLDGRCVAVAQAPPGQRLDRAHPGRAASLRIVRQVASAVDALEESGAEPPPLVAERIWVDAGGDAYLDGLQAPNGIRVRAASSSAALASLLRELAPRSSSALRAVMTRALDGAYLSAGQFASELRHVEAEAARRRRRVTITAALTSAAVAVGILLEIVL